VQGDRLVAKGNGIERLFARQVVWIVEQCVNHAKFSAAC
jgi:hypothetical protein